MVNALGWGMALLLLQLLSLLLRTMMVLMVVEVIMVMATMYYGSQTDSSLPFTDVA